MAIKNFLPVHFLATTLILHISILWLNRICCAAPTQSRNCYSGKSLIGGDFPPAPLRTVQPSADSHWHHLLITITLCFHFDWNVLSWRSSQQDEHIVQQDTILNNEQRVSLLIKTKSLLETNEIYFVKLKSLDNNFKTIKLFNAIFPFHLYDFANFLS